MAYTNFQFIKMYIIVKPQVMFECFMRSKLVRVTRPVERDKDLFLNISFLSQRFLPTVSLTVKI